MSNGSSHDYAFPRKKHWRKCVWSEVKKRLRVPVCDAIVLYMPGIEDFDRPIAISKGFKDANLIGVERDGKVVSALRKRGVFCIHGDVVYATDAFLDNHRIDACLYDWVGPINDNLILWGGRSYRSCANWPHVVMHNNLCGRESDRFGQWLTYGLISTVKTHMDSLAPHRWRAWLALTADTMASRGVFNAERLAWGINIASPRFMSYVSNSGQRFDSVVLSPCDCPLTAHGLRPRKASLKDIYDFDTKKIASIKRQIAAILAARTRKFGHQRKNAKLSKEYRTSVNDMDRELFEHCMSLDYKRVNGMSRELFPGMIN